MTVSGSVSGAIDFLYERERLVWVGAFACYGIGDTVTTVWGLMTGGVAEAGPIAGPALEAAGPVGLVAVKIVVFALFFGVWSPLRTTARVAVPLSLVVVGALVTVWNLLVILSVAVT